MDKKKVYIVTNHDNNYSTAIRLSEEQAKAIQWFIDLDDVNYSVCLPEDEDFGVEYEFRYRLPNGKVKTMITEWLWERQSNCIYPVIQWRNYNPIIKFPKQI